MSATLHVEPAEARPGQIIRLTVLPIDNADVEFGEAVHMRPLDGDPASKDADGYLLVGRPSSQPDRPLQSFGHGEPSVVNDIAYSPAVEMESAVPATAVAQRYRLELSIIVWESAQQNEHTTEVVETVLSVV